MYDCLTIRPERGIESEIRLEFTKDFIDDLKDVYGITLDEIYNLIYISDCLDFTVEYEKISLEFQFKYIPKTGTTNAQIYCTRNKEMTLSEYHNELFDLRPDFVTENEDFVEFLYDDDCSLDDALSQIDYKLSLQDSE